MSIVVIERITNMTTEKEGNGWNNTIQKGNQCKEPPLPRTAIFYCRYTRMKNRSSVSALLSECQDPAVEIHVAQFWLQSSSQSKTTTLPLN